MTDMRHKLYINYTTVGKLLKRDWLWFLC